MPQKLSDLGLENISLKELEQAAELALSPKSDIHRLPFKVAIEQLLAAMVSTTAPTNNKDSLNPICVNEEVNK